MLEYQNIQQNILDVEIRDPNAAVTTKFRLLQTVFSKTKRVVKVFSNILVSTVYIRHVMSCKSR